MNRSVCILLLCCIPITCLAVDKICVAVKSTAWTTFVNQFEDNFNNGRGNTNGFNSLTYSVYTNASGTEYRVFTFTAKYMQHGTNVFDGAHIQGIVTSFDVPAGRMFGSYTNKPNVWIESMGLFQ